jgi:bacterioferritin
MIKIIQLGNINIKGVGNMNNRYINDLNTILESEYMAINSFNALIEHANNSTSKSELQKIQQTHKQHASQIFNEIKNLGGAPSDSIGIEGVVTETISNIKHIGTTDNTSYLKEALEGETMGIESVNKLLSFDLSSTSTGLLNTIVTEYKNNINSLNNLIND